MKSFFGIMVLTFLSTLGAQAQCNDWNWPEDKSTAEEKNVLYTDELRNSNFLAAVKPHRWLLENAPNLNTSIYINGVKIYAGLADMEKDEAKRQEWIDSLMMMYDMRMEYCGEEAEVLPRKAFDAYKYNIRNKDKLPELLELYDKTFDVSGNDVEYYITLPYMSIIYYNSKFHKNLSEEQILNRYDKLMQIMDHKMKNGDNVSKLEEYKPKIDAMLVEIVNVDCEFVKKNMGPKFQENPEDLGLAKKIFGFMLAGKCTDEPLWLEAAKAIQKQEPEYGLAKNIGLKCLGAGDQQCANQYLEQALTLTEDPANKADIYMTMADVKENAGAYAEARSLYYKALEADPTKKEAYRNIGLLYFRSFDTCKGLEDQVKDRLVFIAAYDMFQKAGDSKLMQSAKEQFPSKGEIFDRNYNRGDTMNTGCWIGESVVLRARDE